MSLPHDCHHCCLTRRQCLQVLSASALGASVLSSPLRGMGQDSAAPAKADFVDPAGLRPKPEVRVCGTFLEQPRPYWLGWPGTTYDLEKHQQDYRRRLDESVTRLKLQMGWEANPVSDEASLGTWIAKVKDQKPHGLLVALQHMQCWKWVERIAKETATPLIVFLRQWGRLLRDMSIEHHGCRAST